MLHVKGIFNKKTCKGYDSKLYIRKIIIKPQIRMFKREVIPQTSQFQQVPLSQPGVYPTFSAQV